MTAERDSLGVDVPANNDIIHFLLNELPEEEFENIKIVTFNYDRYLEWRLFKKLCRAKGDPNKALEALGKIKIEHIHGRMPPFDYHEAVLKNPENPKFLEYGYGDISNAERKHYLTDASRYAIENFKTIYTNDEEPNTFAVNAIKEATRVFFLGFGFDEKNMRKLGFASNNIVYDWPSKYVAGTCYEMPPVDQRSIAIKYPFLKDRLFDASARGLFQKHFHILDPNSDTATTDIAQRACCEISAIQDRVPPLNDHDVIGYNTKMSCSTCGKKIEVKYSRSGVNEPWESTIWRNHYLF